MEVLGADDCPSDTMGVTAAFQPGAAVAYQDDLRALGDLGVSNGRLL
jgi:hypothetical protein